MYFYKIGNYVLSSNEQAEFTQVAESNEYRCIKFRSSAEVLVIKSGEEYKSDNE